MTHWFTHKKKVEIVMKMGPILVGHPLNLMSTEYPPSPGPDIGVPEEKAPQDRPDVVAASRVLNQARDDQRCPLVQSLRQSQINRILRNRASDSDLWK